MLKFKQSLTISLLILALMLSGCSHHGPCKPPHFEKKADKEVFDGPPEVDLDVTHIPNATPKIEPLSRFGNPESYEVFGVPYFTMTRSHGYSAEGTASWYGRKFHGLKTSSGEIYDMFGMTAAHRSLPLPTYAKVQNLQNGKEVIVKINDRGPFVKDRIIDLSYAAAKKLGIHSSGIGKVRITAIDPVLWLTQQKDHIKVAHQNKETVKHPEKSKQKEQTQSKLAQKSGTKDANPSKATQLAKTNKQLYIQLATFKKETNAQKLAERATTLAQALGNVDVKIVPGKSHNKDSYRVRVGPFQDQQHAENMQKKFVSLNSGQSKLIYD